MLGSVVTLAKDGTVCFSGGSNGNNPKSWILYFFPLWIKSLNDRFVCYFGKRWDWGLRISMVTAKAIIQNEEFFFQRKWIWEELRVWMLSKHILRILKFSTNIKRTEEIQFSLDIVQNVFVHFIDLILLYY